MYQLMIKTHFAAAHNLMNYQGDCENLHGHNWRVEVTVSARELDAAGLGIDFKILKKETNQLLDRLDHKYLNQLEPFQNVIRERGMNGNRHQSTSDLCLAQWH